MDSQNALDEITGIPLDHGYYKMPSSENEWLQVQQKRRNNDQSVSMEKRSKTNVPGSSTSISNRFEILSQSEDMVTTDINQDKREPKPPPIFIPLVENIKVMMASFSSVVGKDDYIYKCISTKSVKIFPKTSEVYRTLVAKLSELKVNFHTYQLKQDRAYRVVIKNLHSSTDKQDIHDSLAELGYTVRNIANVYHKITKAPLPIFFIDLEPQSNNKEIFSLNYILNAKVLVEAPYKKKEIVQCKRCQQYGHTKSYCWHPFRCVKCGGTHNTNNCTKDKNTPPKCVLCNGDHPANYKGCSVYKDIKKSTFPSLREKSANLLQHVTPVVNEPLHKTINKNADVTTNSSPKPTSYASAVAQKPSPVTSDVSSMVQMMDNFFVKFEKLMFQQSQQIGTLMNLLSTVVSKLK